MIIDWAGISGGDDPAEPGRESQATALRRLALDLYELGVSTEGAPFAVPKAGPRIARLLRGRGSLRADLAHEYAAAHGGKVPTGTALTDALCALEGDCLGRDPVPLALRVATHAGGLLLDLGHPDGRVVSVRPDGWTLLDRSPVLFRRSALGLPLPLPSRTGDLDPLRRRVNVAAADWPLLVGWMLAALLDQWPCPILALTGEQGTGKSTASRLLVSVVDPSAAPVRTCPRDVESWAITAAGSRVVALDNVSGMQPWLSDALCRAVTGDGLVRRALYTDGDISVVSFRRALILNGIDLGTLRGDLADRLLPISLERIDPAARRGEDAQLLADAERAAVLGGLLDLAVSVLAALPSVRLARLPRMADFARLLAALDAVTGWQTLAHYTGQAAGLAEWVIESDPLAAAVRDLLDRAGGWSGTAGELLAALSVPDPRPRDWPATPRALAAGLRRVAPALRELDYRIDGPTKTRTGRRLYRLGVGDPAQPPSPPSAPSSSVDGGGSDGGWASDDGGWRSDDGGCGTVRHAQDGDDGDDGGTAGHTSSPSAPATDPDPTAPESSLRVTAPPPCTTCGDPLDLVLWRAEPWHDTHPRCDLAVPW